MILHHRPQPGQIGCLYHSLYALTGDESVLEHAADTSQPRFHVRLAEMGLLLFTFYCAEAPLPPTPPAFWEALRARFAANPLGATHAPLLVTIAGTTPGWTHQVALALTLQPGEDVLISDSNAPAPITVPWDVFLASDYARAHTVEMLGPLDLDAYPPEGEEHAEIPQEARGD